LVHDGAAAFGLPFPDAAQEFLAPQFAARRLLALHQLAFDDHLRGDAGMIGAGLPEHVLAAHTLETDEDVLNGVVERVPDVERSGDVGRRNDDRERLCPWLGARPRGEGAGVQPALIDAALDGARLIGLFDHYRFQQQQPATMLSHAGRAKTFNAKV
jgi:hypothetical protein